MNATHYKTLLCALVAATTLLGAAATAQRVLQARPYGEPSESRPGGPSVLGLYLQEGDTAEPALRVEGGTPGGPALLVFGNEQATLGVPGGATLLVDPKLWAQAGRFDDAGRFVFALTDDVMAGDAPLFAQAIDPMSYGRCAEFSAGLCLYRRQPVQAPEEPVAEPPGEILVEEFADLLRRNHLENAIAIALNSTGDSLKIKFHGNLSVPICPPLTVGGKVSFEAGIERGTDTKDNVVYDVKLAADVAATMGAGAGVVGAGMSQGAGAEMIWRYNSPHEVARALRSAAILLGVDDRIEAVCLVLDRNIERIDRAIVLARRAVDRARALARSRMPGSNNAVVKRLQDRLDRLRQKRRDLADRGRGRLNKLISWIADERRFLTSHWFGFQNHQTMGVNAGLDATFGANCGIKAEAVGELQVAMRYERVPESEAMAVVHKTTITRTGTLEGGLVIGGTMEVKRVIEITRRFQMGKDGAHFGESGTWVKVVTDGRLLGAYGHLVAGQAGVGGDIVLEMRLADLLAYSRDALDTLLGDDDGKLVALLKAFPIKFEVRGRYEAGIVAGVNIQLDGLFGFGLGASVTMIDRGIGFVYEGGMGGQGDRGETMLHLLVEALREGPIKRLGDALKPHLVGVQNEVATVMAH